MDYTRDFTTVSVAAGEIGKSFNISIISDNITECDETFKLTLNIPASTCGAVNGKTDTTEVTIKDDGRRNINTIIIITLMLYVHACIDLLAEAVLSFHQSQYSTDENITPLSVGLILSRRTSEDVIVEVTITDGSAKGR